MNEREALVAGILAHPGDDTRRLVFADWLDENGDAADREWARVIRTAFPFAGNALPRDPREDALRRVLHANAFPFQRRSRAHFNNEDDSGFSIGGAVREDVYGPMWGPGVVAVGVRHGFVSGLACSWRHFRRRAREWFGRNPVEHVLLSDRLRPFDIIPKPPLVALRTLGESDHFYRSWPEASADIIPRGVPREVWALLDGYVEEYTPGSGHSPHRCYLTAADARRALSRALVAYGLLRAGRALAS